MVAPGECRFLSYDNHKITYSKASWLYIHYFVLTANVMSVVEQSMLKHSKGFVANKKFRLPITLVTYNTFSEKYFAYQFDQYLKMQSSRAFRQKGLLDKYFHFKLKK